MIPPSLKLLRHLAVALVACFVASCVSGGPPRTEPVRLSGQRLFSNRDELAGKLASVSGYLVSADTIADRICLKLLVDETLSSAPTRLIESRRARGEAIADDPIEADLLAELVRTETELAEQAPSSPPRRPVVVQACKRPPTSANERAIRHALEWLEPLRKPERVERAPSLASLRRELQLFYLTRSREYDWAPLAGEEVVVTGLMIDQRSTFEEEIITGVDLVPHLVGIHDAQRNSWLVIDLSFDESLARELTHTHLPRLFKGTTKAALKGLVP